MDSSEERAENLAQYESLDVLVSALYSALEADLSEIGWPSNSRVIFTTSFEQLDSLRGILNA